MKFKITATNDPESLNPKVSFWVLGLSLLYVFPIILADVLYNDDLTHSLGIQSSSNGRVVGYYLMRLISLSNHQANLFPYPQLIASLFLGYAGLLIVENILPEKNTFFKVCLSLSFVINPFFLQNLSYQYDAITMSLSVLCITLSAVTTLEGRKRYLILAVFFQITAYGLYQPTINLYPGLISCFVIIKQLKNLSSLTLILKSTAVFIFSGLIYLLSYPYVTTHPYALEKLERISLDSSVGTRILENINKTAPLIQELFQGNYGFFWGILILFSIFSYSASIIKKAISDEWNSTLKLIICLLIVITFIPGFLLLQKNVTPLPRFYPGYASFIFLVIFLFLSQNKYKFLNFSILLPITLSYSLVSTYANTLKYNDETNKYIGAMIASDLLNNGYNKSSNFLFLNKQPKYEQTKNGIRTHSFMRWLIPQYPEQDDYLTYSFMRRFGIKGEPSKTLDYQKALKIQRDNKLEPIVKNELYSIFKNDSFYFILFEKQNS